MKSTAPSKKNSSPVHVTAEKCRAEEILRLTAGKWKPQILRLAANGTLRFNTLLKQLPGSNKQSVSQALNDLEPPGTIQKNY